MENLKSNKFVLKALSALTGQIIYLGTEKRFFRFDANAGGLVETSAESEGSPRVALIGKQHYKEHKKAYPIQSKRELKQILLLEYPKSESAVCFFSIGDFKDGMRSVIVWQMQFNIHEALDLSTGVVIPEGALINSVSEDKSLLTLAFDEQDIEHWFYRDQKGQPFSGAKRGLIQNAERFLASVGIAETVASTRLSWEQYQEYLQQHLPNFLALQSSDFFYVHASAMPDYSSLAKPFSIIAGIILGGYLAVSSAYLVVRNSMAEEVAQQLSQEARQVFQLRDKAKAKLAQLDDLALLTEGVSASSLIWLEIGALMKDGVEIQAISFLPDGRYIIRGNGDSATSVLSLFSANSKYQGAKFYSATQRRKDRDYFAIAVQLTGQSEESGNEQ